MPLTRAARSPAWSPWLLNLAQGSLLRARDRRASGSQKQRPSRPRCPRFAIAPKRYALFNADATGRPVLRKASAHGLGHLRPPYTEKQAPRSVPKPLVALKDLGVERWQYDVWHRIVQAALDGHADQVHLDDLLDLQVPAVSRYAAMTPTLLRWFTAYNEGKPYREQVRPFNFLLAFQPRVSSGLERIEDAPTEPSDPADHTTRLPWKPGAKRQRGRRHDVTALLRPIAPFEKDLALGAEECFDRETGMPVHIEQLKTYREALAQYHLHPEAKFGNGDFTDAGSTVWRHIVADDIDHIGKEANRWEQQLYLGDMPEAQIMYGASSESLDRLHGSVLRACQGYTVRTLVCTSGLSVGEISAVLQGKGNPSHKTLVRLLGAAYEVKERRHEQKVRAQALVSALRERCQRKGVRQVARDIGIDPANLARMLAGRRHPSLSTLRRWEAGTEQSQQ